jgi:hypothetical protein
MKLITTEQHTQLLANGCAALESAREIDPIPVVKLFTPGGHARYLLTEIDLTDSDRACGLCDQGIGLPELGFVSLRELENVRDKFGLRVERDLNFVADKPLSVYADVAYTRGLIIT